MRLLPLASLLFIVAMTSQPAGAQDAVADFYRGKQVTIVVGSTPGGGYDLYGRLLSRYIGKYIPGNPNVVVQNMPGAAGNTSAAYVANIAAKDGTIIGAPQAGSLVDQLISMNAAQIKHDARKLNYLGSANSEVFTCIVRDDAPVKTFDEIFSKEIILGSSGGTTRDMPMAMKNLLGAKIRFVNGYGGTREVGLAMDSGEVQGLCGMGWTSIQSQRPDWFEKKFVRVLVQESVKGDPDLVRQNVPVVFSHAKNSEQRQMFELLYSQGIFTRPYFVAPEVPKERVEALRTAFSRALADPAAIADAERQRLVITAINGADLEGLVQKLYAIPEPIIARLRAAMDGE